MDIFGEEPEFTDIRVVQRVVDMFEGRPHMQRIVRLGLFGREYDELDDTMEDNYEIDNWVHGYNNFRGYPRLSDMSTDRELSGNHTRSSSSIHQHPMRYWASADFLPQAPINVRGKESDAERKARLLQEARKSKEKAEKKRLKKQKQKERKRTEKLGKEKQNTVNNEEGNGGKQECKAGDSTSPDEKSKDSTDSSIKQFASAKDTDSSEDESGDEDSDTKNDSVDSEELDMASTFVRLAQLKLEQKPKSERREKKKIPVKEEHKTPTNKCNEDKEVEKKDFAAHRALTLEDNIKISTEFAIIGNKFAATGDYNMAVKYFTDAIKYNPTEFKLFGNRSFCFEKKQEYEKALTDAELCLRLAPGWVKGLFRKGRALAGLKRYEEAAQAFREVLKMDSSCAEAAQELMRVQITQLMEYGFTREQSSNALIIHGTVKKALEVLTKLNHQPGAIQNTTFQPAQVVNVTGVSPVLSANTSSAAPLPQSHDAPLKYKPLGPVRAMPDIQSQPKPIRNHAVRSSSEVNRTPLELFPVWVGNLVPSVTESMITNLFNKVGVVYSVKVLTIKRCAFVNFTKQEYCEEAIRRFHGFELNGMKIVVRYPDRIPPGMGISKTALKANNPQDHNMRPNDPAEERNAAGGWRHVHHRGNQKN